MFVPKLVDYFFLWRKMPSSMKVALSTSIKQLVSSIVYPIVCAMHSGWGPELFGKAKVKKISFQYMANQLTLAKQKTVIALGDSNLLHVVGTLICLD